MIKPYSEFKDGYAFKDLKGPMPMPWRLQVAEQAGWHIPRFCVLRLLFLFQTDWGFVFFFFSPAEVEQSVKKGKIYQIAMGDRDDDMIEDDEDEDAEDKKKVKAAKKTDSKKAEEKKPEKKEEKKTEKKK